MSMPVGHCYGRKIPGPWVAPLDFQTRTFTRFNCRQRRPGNMASWSSGTATLLRSRPPSTGPYRHRGFEQQGRETRVRGTEERDRDVPGGRSRDAIPPGTLLQRQPQLRRVDGLQRSIEVALSRGPKPQRVRFLVVVGTHATTGLDATRDHHVCQWLREPAVDRTLQFPSARRRTAAFREKKSATLLADHETECARPKPCLDVLL